MEGLWLALIALGAIVGLVSVVAAAVFLFLRLRAKEPVSIDPRLLLRLYLYVAIIAGLLVFTQGGSSLLRAGMAVGFGEDFSYTPVFVQLPGDQGRQAPTAIELKDRSVLTDAEREQLSEVLVERERISTEIERGEAAAGLGPGPRRRVDRGRRFHPHRGAGLDHTCRRAEGPRIRG